MKKGLLSVVLAAAFAFPVSAQCVDLSGWAVETYKQASSAGLISYSVAANKLTDSITREEFCTLSVNLYERLAGEAVAEPEILPFDDSDSIEVAKAFTLGIVSGNEKGEFCPTNLITRQEMSKMLVNTLDLCGVNLTLSNNEKKRLSYYADFENVSPWAQECMAKAMKYGIINGTSETTIDPLGNATREQAIAASTRAYSSFSNSQISEKTPEIISPKQAEEFEDSLNVKWSDVADAKEYYVIIKNSDAVPIYQKTLKNTSLTLNKSELDGNGTYTLVIGAKTEGGEFFSMPVDFSFKDKSVSTPVPSASTALSETSVSHDSLWNLALTAVTPAPVPLEEKEARVFPNGQRFETEEQAQLYMTEIEIPVWLIKDGKKVSSTKTLTVNSALADDVKAIFNEIYALPQQYPIKSVGGYCWRNSSSGRLSQHSYGTCIDINPNENYYVSAGGTAYSGSYWRPGDDPYSITPGDGIIEIFAKYGWAWGGNAWSSSHDYMHFTYLGN